MKNRLKMLAAVSNELVGGSYKGYKEFGLFTKKRPQYGPGGQFQGMGEEFSPGNTAATVGGGLALGGLGGYGGWRGHKFIQDEFGNQGLESYKQAGRYYRQTGKEAMDAVRGAARWARKAFESDAAGLKEFYVNEKGQDFMDNWKRAAGVGLLASGVPGAILLQPNADEAMKNDVIYRKRDVLGDSLRLGVGSAAGSLMGATSALSPEIAKLATRSRHVRSNFPRLSRAVRTANSANSKLIRANVGSAVGAFGGLGLGYLMARAANKKRIAADREARGLK